jgi:hypothetical protein
MSESTIKAFMKFKMLVAVTLLLSMACRMAMAQTPEFSRHMLVPQQNAPLLLWAFPERACFCQFDSLTTAAAKPERSVGKALLFSAVIPGTGQFYNKSFLKGLAFVGIEIGAWAVNAIYTKSGNDKEAQFERYADAHWSEDVYWDFIYSACTQDPNGAGYDCSRNNLASLRRWERNRFSHYLPEEKNQTYYENIGKYDQFNVGWDDTDTELGRDSANRELYSRMRKSANDQFRLATYGASVVLVNHVLSMLDAAYSTYQFNRHQAKASMGMEMKRYDHELVPALCLNVQW